MSRIAEINVFKPVRPYHLIQIKKRLKKNIIEGESFNFDRKDKAKIDKIISDFNHGINPGKLKRRFIRYLIEQYNSKKHPLSLIELILKIENLSLSQLWFLWSNECNNDHIISIALLNKLLQIKDPKRLPEWIPKKFAATKRSQIKTAIYYPSKTIAQYLIKNDLNILDALNKIGELIPSNSNKANSIITELIEAKKVPYIDKCETQTLMEFGEKQGSEILFKMADYILNREAKEAFGPMSLKLNPEIIKWINSEIGSPLESPGSWAQMSERAQEIYNWFYIKDQWQKIIQKFKENSRDKRRSEFWNSLSNCVTDARFYSGRDMAICMIGIKNYLIIEFGDVGAVYIYKEEFKQLPFGQLQLYFNEPSASFKHELPIKNHNYSFVKRMFHTGYWEDRFIAELIDLKIIKRVSS